MNLLLIEDDPIMGESLADRFRLEGVEVVWHQCAQAAIPDLRRGKAGLVISDIRLPDIPGDRLFEAMRQEGLYIPFLFITGYGEVERAVALLKQGAVDYITKPFDLDRLVVQVKRMLGRGEDALGISPAMKRIEQLLGRIAPLDTTVLISGESGVGKEVAARRLHALGRGGPFVAVNCAALAEGIAESELFGHERGAFTGALHVHRGVFEQASGGTLLLDEVGDMPLPLQAKLLRVIQERVVVRVGGERPIPVDVRIVCTTHRDLRALVEEGRFREDLFFRLYVTTLSIPPLRERREDILWLAERFLKEGAVRHGLPLPSLTPDAREALLHHSWPGNVRELKHCLERALIFSPQAITGDDIAQALELREAPLHAQGLQAFLEGCERQFILRALEAHGGRVGRTAERLGISRKALWQKMKRLGIERFRTEKSPAGGTPRTS